ncbi:META domain-containing protein [Micromonospora craniellae]|uniref:META domain-containing protein n=1 Tax=Micromonospora craniellae TaxID=2294034 RepID=A0A372G2S2_9ACTN|nr:META domain-containing protein [Micromonospora craniellae]QOC89909.1 hypothetical protein ID554_16905 [Micromonospora craniellae]RFS47056.1 hypothetical protein D0Q02_07820 [Micromonospora craniellae]
MRRYLIGTIAATALVLTGCAQHDTMSAGPDPVTVDAASAAQQEPTELIGSWTAAGTDVASGTVVQFTDRSLRVFDGCGVRHGSWNADQSGLLIADMHSGGGCTAAPDAGLGWLLRADGFRADGDTRVLLDDTGAELARLRLGGRPDSEPDMDPSWLQPPTVTDETRRWLAAPPALPAQLADPTSEELVGRWVPVGAAADSAGRWPKPASVEFVADGTWTGSDGCNSYAPGRWATDGDGAFLATGGVSTMIGCDNVPTGLWLITARQAGLDGDVLVLRDAQGAETGRLVRG